MAFSNGVHYGSATQDVHAAFAAEVAALGGEVTDCFDDGTQLIARSVLPLSDDVLPGDTVRGGVAIRAVGEAIFVHPYTLRQVCTNGAIMADATSSVRIERALHDGIVVPAYEIASALAALSEAVRSCARHDAFAHAVGDMRVSLNAEANIAINLLPMLARMPFKQARMHQFLIHMFRLRQESADSSVFDLMNDVTAFARDTDDPETKWTLETIGGTLASRVRSPVSGAAATVGA